MTLATYRPYPGTVLVVSEHGSVLFGAPADAFKATKRLCAQAELAFPRTLVAPQTMLVAANPQFNPEFFLYDFLFVYGAAFKPGLEDERLELVLDPGQLNDVMLALRMTLTGPTQEEMAGYVGATGDPLLPEATIARLSRISTHMAIKKGDRPRTLDEMITAHTFDSRGHVALLDGTMKVRRTGPQSFSVQVGSQTASVDLAFREVVVPFSTLPKPSVAQRPLTFGIKTLGARSGFDLSGPTTGFLIWIDGKAIVYDGPVGSRYLLHQQGITLDDVEAVILSHCHEDHMGAFVELILAGRRPTVLTTEPVYRSALTKLAGYFGQSEQEVAKYIDYRRVTPDEPVEAFGAELDFFYTVHAIPTVGVSVRMRDSNGVDHRVQISGDTMNHQGLDAMLKDGVIDAETHEAMRCAIPEKRVDNALYFADVGEAIIHGHPGDWAGNPNDVLYYHCPDNEHTRSFGHRIAEPGAVEEIIKPRTVVPLTSARLLHALRPLQLDDPELLSELLSEGRHREIAAGEVLYGGSDRTEHEEADPKQDTVSVILSGTASVNGRGAGPVTTLGPGDYLGVVELVDEAGRHPATITAVTPMELFCLDGTTFYQSVRKMGRQDALKRIWQHRPAVEGVRILRDLDMATRDLLAQHGSMKRYTAGHVIVRKGADVDSLFLLTKGRVQIKDGRRLVAELSPRDSDRFWGEQCISRPRKPMIHSVRARTAVRALRIEGDAVRTLLADRVGVRYAFEVVLKARAC